MNSICNGATNPPAEEIPTLTAIVVVVVDAIAILVPAYGSVALGYPCSVEFPSCVQVNIIESFAICTVLDPATNPWPAPKVKVNTPSIPVYVANDGVNLVPVFAVTASLRERTK